MLRRSHLVAETDHNAVAPTRRRLLAIGGGIIASPFIQSSKGSAQANKRLVVVNYGGTLGEAKQKAYYDPFTKETGIPITVVSGPDFAKVRAQVMAKDVEWDVVDLIDSVLPLGDRLGLFEKIDESIVKRDGIIPGARREFAIGNYAYAGGIGYPTPTREKAPAKPPGDWREFFDIKGFPGRRGLRNRPQETIELALMADGVPAKDVYPCDVERAFKVLDRIKPDISHWIGAQAQTTSLIQQNECDFTATYKNQVMIAQRSGVPVGFSPKQNMLGIGFTTVLKGTSNKEAAMRLCAFIMRKENQIALANLTALSPVYAVSESEIEPSVREWLPDVSNPDNLVVNPEWWADRLESLTLRFQEWQRR